MKSSTLIVWLLVAACIAIDLAMIGELQLRHNEWPEAGGVVGLGLTFAQLALIALWTVWGRSSVLVRAVCSLLSVLAVSCLASYSSDGGLDSVGDWFGVLLLYVGLILIPFIIARFMNYDLNHEGSQAAHNARGRLPSNQFTIWGLLSLMTAAGITLATVRYADFPIRQRLEVAAFLTLLTAPACTVLLLSLSRTRMMIAVMTTMVICPIVGFLLSITGVAPGEGALLLILMTCIQGAALLSAVLVLRAAGYRLARPAELSGATALRSSDAPGSGSVGQADEP
ncbi:MAG: hypothetical protein ABI614_21985 [Planctomycetota bacterium]